MISRVRLHRSTFLKMGHEQNSLEAKLMGLPKELMIDPEEAWHKMYGNRKYVYLDLDKSAVPFGGKGAIVNDEAGNGFYGVTD